MRKVINIISIIVLLALILGLLLAIGAETDKPSTKKPSGGIGIDLSKEDIPRLLRIIRIWKLVDELELKEEQLVEFLPRFKELNELRFEHSRSRRKAVDELKKLLETDSSQDHIKSVIDELRNSEIEFRQKERQLEDKLNSGLTIRQQAKFVVFQTVYWRDMQQLRRKLQELGNLRDQRPRPQTIPSRGEKEE